MERNKTKTRKDYEETAACSRETVESVLRKENGSTAGIITHSNT